MMSESKLLLSSHDYFREVVAEAMADRKVKADPLVESYLVQVLQFFMSTDNLFDEVDSRGRRYRETLAEMYLRAAQSEPQLRVQLLKKVGDGSLYISGFFGDSLQRKIVDIDYYTGMGGAAFRSLADEVDEETSSFIYREFSVRFTEFVEVLTSISSRVMIQSEDNLLRLYENFINTGSKWARERLVEKGLLNAPFDLDPDVKKSTQ